MLYCAHCNVSVLPHPTFDLLACRHCSDHNMHNGNIIINATMDNLHHRLGKLSIMQIVELGRKSEQLERVSKN